MDYLKTMNERQKEAVLHTEGPLLILAGAGAGKTKTVTHRILHLIHQGVAPHEILAITFTNKAAKEMRERVNKLISEDQTLNLPISMGAFGGEKPFVSTFHSLGVHILRDNAALVGLPKHFTIFDKSDAKHAVKEAVEAAGLDLKQFDPGKVQSSISREKGNGVRLADVRESYSKNYSKQLLLQVWERYEAILRREKSLDFDDLLLVTASLLKTNTAVREHYQKIWKYVHIDEYQDTNKVQYQISRLLTGDKNNICVVGDIDQNIYSWRGADIQNILNFEKDYPSAKVILLEENYRSTQTILQAANTIIEKNKIRRKKTLFTNNGAGDKIGLFGGYDETEEANFVAQQAKALIAAGTPAHEIAVLFRANYQSRILEEAFIHHEVDYQVLGVRFYERKEIKDMLSYIRGALNPDSSGDLKRVINVPARGVGKVTLTKILAGQEAELPATMKAKMAKFRALMEGIKNAVHELKTSDVIKFVLENSGLEMELKSGTDEDLERLENIQELVTLATKYDSLPIPTGTEKLLEEAALASDQDELIKDQDAVKLMTVHASKGLEFDAVFITGLEENLFPHKRLSETSVTQEAEEEERRLFYVAVTRARRKLYLCFASMRTIFGSKQMNIPSEFITDIDEELIEREETRSRTTRVVYF